jgi:hypothetical protein
LSNDLKDGSATDSFPMTLPMMMIMMMMWIYSVLINHNNTLRIAIYYVCGFFFVGLEE